MPRIASPVSLNEAERRELEAWLRKGSVEQRMVQRAHIVLESAGGKTVQEVAQGLGLRPGTVSKWRNRFYRGGLEGLSDQPRPGRRPKYNGTVEQRVLAQLDGRPPDGHSAWTARLLASALGDVSPYLVRRVLRRHGVHLERRHVWCVGTDPEFGQRAADILGLYLDPPANALVLSIDHQPAMPMLQRAQGWVRLPERQALKEFRDQYRRRGATTLPAALEISTRLVKAGHYPRHTHRDFLDFMSCVAADYPAIELCVVLDGMIGLKARHDRWLARHPNIHFHYSPNRECWLDQVELWCTMLCVGVSRCIGMPLRKALDAFTEAHSTEAYPFEWTKNVLQPGQLLIYATRH